jgi:hypothetical protein
MVVALEDAMSNFLSNFLRDARPGLLSGLLGAGALGALAIGGAPAQASPLAGPLNTPLAAATTVAPGNDSLVQVQYRDRRGYRDHRRGYRGDRFVGRHYGGRPIYRDHRYDPGAAVAAGIIGLATGAIIAGALAPQPVYPVAPHRVAPYSHRVVPHRVAPHYTRSDLDYCSRKYRSFDPVSFTYLGYDGRRHYCRIP